jgi:hypothetical protein
VAFAEKGEHNDARNVLGIRHMNPKKLWDNDFILDTFAKADLYES